MDNQVIRPKSVYARLREDIVTCRMAPGERLLTESLRNTYDVGGSPVREALMRLQAEGLVTLEQNKGFRVADVSLEKLEDLTANRIEVEATALRWSIDRGDIAWEGRLVSAMHHLASVYKGPTERPFERNVDWLEYHRAFHLALVEGCGSPILLDIRARLFDQAERYVALSISANVDDGARDHIGEHRALMETALERNAEKAVELNREHIQRTTDKLKRIGNLN